MPDTLTQLPAVAEARQVQRIDAEASAPSIESILHLAVQQNTDPANLERLVALFERVEASRAVKAFNVALAAFRTECPVILKTRDAVDTRKSDERGKAKVMYRYADLSEITKQIDPILHRHGLTYTWDTDLVDDRTTVTCTVHHIAGHSRSGKFTCKGSGTSIMSAAQIAASATTYGRRYSLTNALGLTTDEEDDDGRRASPMPRPPSDPSAPRVPTRDQRNAPRVTAGELNNLLGEWKATRSPNGTRAEFAVWARGVLLTDCAMEALGDWDPDSVSACWEALR